MLVSSLYQILDGAFVGHILGAEAFAAVNLVMPLVIIFAPLHSGEWPRVFIESLGCASGTTEGEPPESARWRGEGSCQGGIGMAVKRSAELRKEKKGAFSMERSSSGVDRANERFGVGL